MNKKELDRIDISLENLSGALIEAKKIKDDEKRAKIERSIRRMTLQYTEKLNKFFHFSVGTCMGKDGKHLTNKTKSFYREAVLAPVAEAEKMKNNSK